MYQTERQDKTSQVQEILVSIRDNKTLIMLEKCKLVGLLLVVLAAYTSLGFECENEENGLRSDIEVIDIKLQLQNDVFGQPLVYTILPKVLKEYKEQQKSGPLILSFHGSPGTGKNFVSNILAEKFFVRGKESRFFQTFLATKDFPATTDRNILTKYKKDLKRRLHYSSCKPAFGGRVCCFLQDFYEVFWGQTFAKENTFCRRMYIFDEVDSLPDDFFTLDAPLMMTPFFNKTIFVFLSNVGGQEIFEEIANLAMHNFTKDQIDQNKLVQIVKDSVVKNPWKYNPSMVQYIIPFLPLEREHVKVCAQREITRRIPLIKETDLIKLTDQVLKELLFHGFKDNYSLKGCKNVAEKVNLVIARERLLRKETDPVN